METAQLFRASPEHLLRDLEREGLRIAARSGKLEVSPSKAITPKARELIRKNKPSLLHLLKPHPISAKRITELRKLFRPPGIIAFRPYTKISDQQRLDYENEIRDRLDQIQDPTERIQLICILAEMELDRLRPKEKWPVFDNRNGDLNNEEIDWLLSNCYQVGLISDKDLVAMGNSIKKSFEALKTIGSLDDLILEESAWSFMALNSIFGMLENRESRGDRRVKIAENTGLPRKKSSSL